MSFPCEIQQRPAQPTLAVRFTAPVQELPQHIGRAYGSVMQYLTERGEYPAGMPFALYHNMDMANLDIEAGFPVAHALPGEGDVQPGEVPAGTYAIGHYTGSYAELGPAYDELTDWTAAQGYIPTGVAYEWYLNGPDEAAPEQLKTDIMFEVTRAE